MKKPLKICVGSSAGGHTTQLLKLLEKSGDWPCQPSFYVTTLEALTDKFSDKGPVYVIGECNRHHPIKALIVLIKSMKLVMKERPDVIITTGSFPLAMVCFFSKLCGAKVVWIDSVANVEKLSMSGNFVRHFADLFLTQWPDITTKYKNVEYAGSLI
jgi:UDP-N-acetylglucosamine:LPS N-acetylglucosamine transferase